MNRKNKNQFRMQTAELGKSLRNNKTLYLFLLLPIVYFIIFKYVPMFGNIIAFRKYIPGQSYFGVSWEGFRYVEMFLKDEAFWSVFKNTVVLSGLSLLICFPIPILFSLLLNEICLLYTSPPFTPWYPFIATGCPVFISFQSKSSRIASSQYSFGHSLTLLISITLLHNGTREICLPCVG